MAAFAPSIAQAAPTKPQDTNVLEVPQAKLPPLPSGFVPQIPKPSASASPTPVPTQRSQVGDLFTPRDSLINSIIMQESGGNPRALGKRGERGLMQLMPATAQQYGVTPDMLDNPNINRHVGSRYLSDLLKHYKGNEFLALVAYNSGQGNVDKGRLLPQAVKYATSVLSRAGSRLAGALGSIEGTAYAEELPPLPSGFKPTAAPPPAQVAATAPAQQPAAAQPQAPLPALPSGAQPSASPQQQQPGFNPNQWRPTISAGPGGLRVGLSAVPQPIQARTQEIAGNVVLQQVDDALAFYDKNILPRESEFTGTLASSPGSALRGYAQWPEYRHSRLTGLVGGQVDPAVRELYGKIGPVMAEQLKALIGGRVGATLVSGPMAPHLPDPSTDSIPMIRYKLIALKHNVPVMMKAIEQMRSQGMNDEQIIQGVSQMPYDDTGGVDLSPEEQQLMEQYGK